MSILEKRLLLVSLGIYSLIAIFSYAYVDLNLTITSNETILSIIETLQRLGYFKRNISTGIYLVILLIAFSFFCINLWLFYKKKAGLDYLKISTVINVIILIFAYPFLSSDLFNYLFDAKIILNYHASPYTHRPLDFPGDEWLRFMRWVHRYSPYGPLWLIYSLIPAILGFGKFILNFLTFKIFISIFHLVNSYLMFKILGKVNPKYQLVGTAFYSLNPTLLIEGVANAHNDVVLASSILGSIYFLTLNKKILSLTTLIMGSLVKYIPILIVGWFFKEAVSAKKDIERYIKWSLVTMIVFTYVFSSFKIIVPFVSTGATQVQFQPWYLFWTIPLVALLYRVPLLAIATALCFGASLRYLSFLYYGDWSHPGTIVFMQTAVILPPTMITITLLLKKYLRI